MAKLYFKYGVMGSGKTTELLQIAHDYELAKSKVFLAKPYIDVKGNNKIVSRMADLSREVVVLPKECQEFERKQLANILEHNIILIDEAQFLSEEYVNLFLKIAHKYDIPVICFGLRTTFDGKGFEGSSALFAVADTVEEISTRAICKICGKSLATKNLRLINGKAVFEGSTVVIDNKDTVDYIPTCSKDFLLLQTKTKSR